MMPTTLIFIVSFAFLLIPSNNPLGLSAQKEKETKINPAMSLSIHFNAAHSPGPENTETTKAVNPGSAKSGLELPPEEFTETPVHLESWMNSPESWGNKSN